MSSSPARFIYLASGSPRRRELIAQLGLGCRVIRIDVDEAVLAGEQPADHVCRLAAAKARAALQVSLPLPAPIVAADTAVALGNEIFGKPADEADGLRMLARLSGRTHEVFTAVAVADGRQERVELSRSEVTFRQLDTAEIAAYWRTGEPADKAGGYAVQGIGAIFIAALTGSYSGVMGLPLFETARLLGLFGVPVLVPAPADA